MGRLVVSDLSSHGFESGPQTEVRNVAVAYKCLMVCQAEC